jgi:hypothetical protein
MLSKQFQPVRLKSLSLESTGTLNNLVLSVRKTLDHIYANIKNAMIRRQAHLESKLIINI